MIKAYNKWKKFFIINLLVGVFTFFMLISLQLLNQLDAIWHFGYGGAGNWERGIGRWFWPYLDELRFGLFTDPFCNVLALCTFIMGNIILFEIVGFEPDKFRTYAVSYMFIVSTSICAWLSFRYMSNTFATAYLLSILVVFFSVKGVNITFPEKWKVKKPQLVNDIISVMLASICLMLSLASYQAFFDSTCLVMLATFMLMLYRNEEAKALVRFFVKSVIAIVIGAILYFIGMKITFLIHGIEHLANYNEGDSLGVGNTILNIPTTIGKTLYYFNEYFFHTMFRWNRLQEHMVFRLLLFGVIIAALVAGIVRIAKRNVIYSVLFAVCGLLLPVATNVVLFMATESFLSIQMTNGLAMFVAISFVIVFEILVGNTDESVGCECVADDDSDATDQGATAKAQENNELEESDELDESAFSDNQRISYQAIIHKAVCAAVVITSVLVIYGNYISVQIDQEACREGTTGTVNIAGEILDTLKNIGYADKGGNVCFVGSPCGNERFMYSEIYPMANELMQFGNWGPEASVHSQTWFGVYREYFGYFVAPCSEEEYEAIVARDDVAAMPMYPRQGSVTEIDGIIVVKVSNIY